MRIRQPIRATRKTISVQVRIIFHSGKWLRSPWLLALPFNSRCQVSGLGSASAHDIQDVFQNKSISVHQCLLRASMWWNAAPRDQLRSTWFMVFASCKVSDWTHNQARTLVQFLVHAGLLTMNCFCVENPSSCSRTEMKTRSRQRNGLCWGLTFRPLQTATQLLFNNDYWFINLTGSGEPHVCASSDVTLKLKLSVTCAGISNDFSFHCIFDSQIFKFKGDQTAVHLSTIWERRLTSFRWIPLLWNIQDEETVSHIITVWRNKGG